MEVVEVEAVVKRISVGQPNGGDGRYGPEAALVFQGANTFAGNV